MGETRLYQLISLWLFVIMIIGGHYYIKLSNENKELKAKLNEVEVVSLR